jgi:hypothetical protein
MSISQEPQTPALFMSPVLPPHQGQPEAAVLFGDRASNLMLLLELSRAARQLNKGPSV